jgi:hypothetical protein
LAGKSAGDLEAEQGKAFKAYTAKQAELAAKKTTTDAEKIALETLKREWEATKTAKAQIIRANLMKKLKDAKTAKGLDGLRNAVSEASKKQLDLAKKHKEFPRNVTTANDLGAAETEIKLIRDTLLILA